MQFKWNTWARRWLNVELAFYLLWLIAFQAFVILIQVHGKLLTKVGGLYILSW